jgi:predicted nucleic acid-binding protein
MVPAIVLSEYLVKFDAADRQEEFNILLARYVHVVPFDQHTAEIAADIARRYMLEKQSGPQNAVARQVNEDRVCLKADTLIIATALQHSATAFLTNDEPADRVAKFAGLNSHLIINLPDPPPPIPINASPPKGRSVQQSIGFDEPDVEDEE